MVLRRAESAGILLLPLVGSCYPGLDARIPDRPSCSWITSTALLHMVSYACIRDRFFAPAVLMLNVPGFREIGGPLRSDQLDRLQRVPPQKTTRFSGS